MCVTKLVSYICWDSSLSFLLSSRVILKCSGCTFFFFNCSHFWINLSILPSLQFYFMLLFQLSYLILGHSQIKMQTLPAGVRRELLTDQHCYCRRPVQLAETNRARNLNTFHTGKCKVLVLWVSMPQWENTFQGLWNYSILFCTSSF